MTETKETAEMPVVHLWRLLMWHCDQNIVGKKEVPQ
jgi:hypothetical protein